MRNRLCHAAIVRLGILVLILVFLQLSVSVAAQSKGPNSSKKASPLPLEDRLRIRLQFNPHDKRAHEQLIDQLRKKNAFRALAGEDATWIKNNPNDVSSYVTLTELVSNAKVALHDPEFAIAQQ